MRQTRPTGLCGATVRPQSQEEVIALLCGAVLPLWRLLASLLVAPQVAEETSGDWIPHTRSPLGARRTRELARRGAFDGAYKVGRTWLIPRAELNAFIEREGRLAIANDNGDEGAAEGVSDLAATMGYVLKPPARPATRRRVR